jgi:hypothetical protein
MGIANPRKKIQVSKYNDHKSSGSHTDGSFKKKAVALILDLEWSLKIPDADGFCHLEMAMCPSCGNTKAEGHKNECALRELLDMR